MAVNSNFFKSPEVQEAILKSRRGNGNPSLERSIIRGAAGRQKQQEITGKRVGAKLEAGKQGLELAKGRFDLAKTGAAESTRRTEEAIKQGHEQLGEDISTRRFVTGASGASLLGDILGAQLEKKRATEYKAATDKLLETAKKNNDPEGIRHAKALQIMREATN